ncbi:hypothetical protein [Nostoc sp. 106C]|uniref:hypothetical protein n=1 Tax=Nostoc sp. 106C TaxID=1932667 RepID=UPI001413513C|nr:hypothetical protein [Nostoc sp. 106C]
MVAFGLEQFHQLKAAEKTARQAIALISLGRFQQVYRDAALLAQKQSFFIT